MASSPFVRGAVVKCRFPYDARPDKPGPQPHYCLLIAEFELGERTYAAVCYGTSRLDEQLIRAHAGMILSVPSRFIKGPMPGPVTHFVADHVAIIPHDEQWFYLSFKARLDYIPERARKGDFQRQRLFQDFLRHEAAMNVAAAQAAESLLELGRIGLPPNRKLR
ncbi:hypothetical protein [Burkholderia sp. MBR-1]|uniref:hypothetical protein n=1 Tax=Burkholderia sp. MBR-1 TaxID=2732364 RepID=UPI0015EF5FFD|nr:hypothetical protein [Burkholderia sp. MBR-1]QMI49747.1 hypothetical protein MBR110_30190 [Burkholderia sp. MBR-1]